MEDCPFEEMMDFLKKDDLQELDLGQDDLSKVANESTLVDEFMNDPQFWNTFLNEKEVLKQNVVNFSTSDYASEIWVHQSPSPLSTHNYASSSSACSDRSGSSPSYLSEVCTTVSTDESVVHLDSNSSYQANSSLFFDDDSSRAADVTSPCLSNYDSSVSGIDIGADVIVVTSSEVYAEEEVGDSDDEEMEEIYVKEDGLKPLKLSQEEKRLMDKEGVVLPKYLPLTKTEEKELKRIRRKIRNKASAQNSRKRKKEYVDGLEKRVKRCTLENNVLKQTIRQMQDRNKSLVSELSRLQNIITNSSSKPVQSSTTLMVLLCSFALLLLPNLLPTALESKDLFDGKKSDQKLPPVGGRSRTLLSSPTVWDKGRAEPSFKEDNISNLYESIPPTTTSKLPEWSLAAGQHIAKAPFQMSDAVTTFPKDFLAPQKNCGVEEDIGSLQDAVVWSVDSSMPCVQEVVIDSSPD